MATVLACSDLSPERVLEFCCKLAAQPPADYVIDFSAFRHAPPFGMLLASAALRRFVARMSEAGRNVGFAKYKGNGYAAHQGFFQSFGCDHGNKPGVARGSDTYIPITQLEVDPLGSTEHIHTTIDKQATRLARLLLPQAHIESVQRLHYCFFEIMRNVVEHSGTGRIWLCAQGWPTKQQIEVAILDEGMGIRRSLGQRYELKSDEHALTIALEEGSSVSAAAADQDDPFGFGPQVGVDIDMEEARESRCNSGYGLFIVSEMCREGGEFTIASGTKCLRQRRGTSLMLDGSHGGVAVAALLSTAGEGIHKFIQRVATKKFGDTPSTRPRMVEDN